MVSVALTALRIIFRASWVFEPSEVFRILIDASPLTLRSKAAREGVCHVLHQLKVSIWSRVYPESKWVRTPDFALLSATSDRTIAGSNCGSEKTQSTRAFLIFARSSRTRFAPGFRSDYGNAPGTIQTVAFFKVLVGIMENKKWSRFNGAQLGF